MGKYFKTTKSRILAAVMAVCILAGSLQGYGVQAAQDTQDTQNVQAAQAVQDADAEPEEGLSGTCGGLNVSVKAEPGALAEAASVDAEDLTESRSAAYQAVFDENEAGTVLGVYDISLRDAAGEEIEPEQPVNVTFSGPFIESALADGEIAVYHCTKAVKTQTGGGESDTPQGGYETGDGGAAADGGTETHESNESTAQPTEALDGGEESQDFKIGDLIGQAESEEQPSETGGIQSEELQEGKGSDDDGASTSEPAESQITMEDLEEMELSVSEGRSIAFSVGGFSEFAVVKKSAGEAGTGKINTFNLLGAGSGNNITDNGTMKSVQIGEDQYLQMDKYLSDSTGTMNGQDAYDLYIEQAVVDAGKKTDKFSAKAPAAQSIILVLDISGSMADAGKVPAANEALKNFFNRVKDSNQKRIDTAKAGGYADIPAENAETQMQSHLIRITGITKFHETGKTVYDCMEGGSKDSGGCDLLDDGDVEMMFNKAEILDSELGFPASGFATNTGNGLEKARELLEKQKDKALDPNVCLLTDGITTGGQAQYTKMIEEAKKSRRLGLKFSPFSLVQILTTRSSKIT